MCRAAFILGLSLMVLPPLWLHRLARGNSPDEEGSNLLLAVGIVALGVLLFLGALLWSWFGGC